MICVVQVDIAAWCDVELASSMPNKGHTHGTLGINVLDNLRVVAELGRLAKELLSYSSIAKPRLDLNPLPTLFCVSIP